MKTVLFCVNPRLKSGCLDQFLAFAKEANERAAEYSAMLKRYDIIDAKVWHHEIDGKKYVFVYHQVGSQFEEKMKGWDNSPHPFDTWFRESILAVYDIENAEGMPAPEQVFEFVA